VATPAVGWDAWCGSLQNDRLILMIGDLTKKRMIEVLMDVDHGHLAYHTNRKVFCVPIFFVYRNGCIYGHTYVGEKIRIMRKNPQVCMLVHTFKSLWNWDSVVIHGTYEELKGKEATDAVRILTHRLEVFARKSQYFPNVAFDGHSHYSRRDGKRVIIYRIKIRSMTGRFERS